MPDPADVARPSPDNLVEGNSLEGEGIEVSESNGNQIVGNAVHAAANGIDLYNSHNGLIKQNDVTPQLGRHRADRLAQQPHRGEQRQRDERHRASPERPVAQQRRRRQHGQRQQRRHRGQRPGWRPAPAASSRATPPATTRATASRSPTPATRSPGTPPTTTATGASTSPSGASIDGGGNSASDNTQPAQCFNVRCDGQARAAGAGAARHDPAARPEQPVDQLDGHDPLHRHRQRQPRHVRVRPRPRGLRTVHQPDHAHRRHRRRAHVPRSAPSTPSGNVDASPAEHSWARDRVVAARADDDRQPRPTPSRRRTDATFTFSANEPGATFQCRLDSASAGGRATRR